MGNANDVVGTIIGEMSRLEEQIYEGYEANIGIPIATRVQSKIRQQRPGGDCREEVYKNALGLGILTKLTPDQILHVISALEAADVFIAGDGKELVLPVDVLQQYYHPSVVIAHPLANLGPEGREFIASMYLREKHYIDLGACVRHVGYQWKEAVKA